jgi:hypothetical protein
MCNVFLAAIGIITLLAGLGTLLIIIVKWFVKVTEHVNKKQKLRIDDIDRLKEALKLVGIQTYQYSSPDYCYSLYDNKLTKRLETIFLKKETYDGDVLRKTQRIRKRSAKKKTRDAR